MFYLNEMRSRANVIKCFTINGINFTWLSYKEKNNEIYRILFFNTTADEFCNKIYNNKAVLDNISNTFYSLENDLAYNLYQIILLDDTEYDKIPSEIYYNFLNNMIYTRNYIIKKSNYLNQIKLLKYVTLNDFKTLNKIKLNELAINIFGNSINTNEIKIGEINLISGLNGSGKSILLNCLKTYEVSFYDESKLYTFLNNSSKKSIYDLELANKIYQSINFNPENSELLLINNNFFIKLVNNSYKSEEIMSIYDKKIIYLSILFSNHIIKTKNKNIINTIVIDDIGNYLDDFSIINLIDLIRELNITFKTQFIITSSSENIINSMKRKFSLLDNSKNININRFVNHSTEITVTDLQTETITNYTYLIDKK